MEFWNFRIYLLSFIKIARKVTTLYRKLFSYIPTFIFYLKKNERECPVFAFFSYLCAQFCIKTTRNNNKS